MTKSDKFNSDARELAALCKVLSHPARIAILHYLAEARKCISGDISNEIPLSRTTVLQHLKELKRLGLIQGEVEGVKVNYCLNPQYVSLYKNMLHKFFCELEIEVVCTKKINEKKSKQFDFYKDLGFISNACLNFTPRQAYRAIKNYGAVMLDIRADGFSDYKCPDVKNIIFMPYEQLGHRFKELTTDTLLIIFDSSGIHSAEAVKHLMQMGYFYVANLAGGIVEWERDGMPMIVDKRERLSGSCMCQLRPREKR